MPAASIGPADTRSGPDRGERSALRPRGLQALVLLSTLIGALGLLLLAEPGAQRWALSAVVLLIGLAAVLLRRLQLLKAALAQREHELEVERHQRSHQARMAAVGAMAAGVLHDIGNPIAAIDGVARAMKEAQAGGDCVPGDGLCDPELILRETARLEGFTRMIAGLAATPSTEPQLLDLNELVRTSLLLLHYDPRLAGVRIETELDGQLPALHGVGDSLMQLVMTLLVNAADALRDRPQPLIQVKTRVDGSTALLSVQHNGSAMEPETLRRDAEPLHTARPAGHGAELGLPFVRAIAGQHGGDVQIRLAPPQGTEVAVRLALHGTTGP